MNMKKILTVLLLLSFALIMSCDKDKDDDPPPETASVPQPTQKTLTFVGNNGNHCKVTISSPDQHLPSAWNALCNDVVTALESAYNVAPGAGKSEFRRVFANDAGAQIVLVNNLANNYEIRAGEFKTLYLKTSSIATADYATAIGCMDAGSATVGKATPTKDRVFLG
jgi:hypothetical protein